MYRIYKFNEDKEGFGKKLKSMMEKRQMKIANLIDALAEKNNPVDINTINKWRAGNRIPNLDTLKKLSDILGISMQELYLPNSIYELEISNDLQQVIDNRYELKRDDYRLITELKSYSNYLFQKMLFSYLNMKEISDLKSIFKYYEVTASCIDRFQLKKDKQDFDDFYIKIKNHITEQYGISLPYKIDYKISKEILIKFNSFVRFKLD